MTLLKKLCYTVFFFTFFFIGIYRSIIPKSSIMERIASYVTYPFLSINNYVIRPIKSLAMHWESKDHLLYLLQAYKKRYEDARAEVISYKTLYNFDTLTGALRTFAHRYATDKAILAQIVVKNFDPQHHFFLIDAGSLAGVEIDNVVVYKNCLIGKVTHVYPYYSRVILVTDRSCKVAAYCLETSINGIHEGCNVLSHTSLSYVNHLEKIKLNDTIISSGEGLIFPRGFALGTIAAYNLERFHYTITVEPALNFAELEYCYVVKKGFEEK